MKVHLTRPKFVRLEEWEEKMAPDYVAIIKRGKDQRHRWEDDPDKADMILLLEDMTYKSYGHIKELMAEPLLVKYPNKTFTMNYEDGPAGFLPGAYIGLPRTKFDPTRHRSGVFPFPPFDAEFYKHVEAARDLPKFLFSFKGSCSWPLRRKIFDRYEGTPSARHNVCEIRKWYDHTQGEREEYFREILDSKFVLCPRGLSTFTHRVYEVMHLGRCPVIISDDWVPPAGIEWEKCAIFIAEAETSRIEEILKEREKEWESLGCEALQVWRRYFSGDKWLWYMLDQIRDILLSRDKNYDEKIWQKHWKSREFCKPNKWLIEQRAVRKAKGMVKEFLSYFSAPSKPS